MKTASQTGVAAALAGILSAFSASAAEPVVSPAPDWAKGVAVAEAAFQVDARWFCRGVHHWIVYEGKDFQAACDKAEAGAKVECGGKRVWDFVCKPR